MGPSLAWRAPVSDVNAHSEAGSTLLVKHEARKAPDYYFGGMLHAVVSVRRAPS